MSSVTVYVPSSSGVNVMPASTAGGAAVGDGVAGAGVGGGERGQGDRLALERERRDAADDGAEYGYATRQLRGLVRVGAGGRRGDEPVERQHDGERGVDERDAG